MKAIIFDYGGVIALHKEPYVPIYPDTEAWHQAEKGEIPEEEFWKRLEEYYHKTTAELLQMLFDERELNKPLIEYLRENKGKYKLATINNGLAKILGKMIAEWNLNEVFDVIICSATERLVKPDPKIFLLACERLGLKPEDCLFVSKKESYVEVVQSLGMKGLVYEGLEEFKKHLSDEYKY